jgi:2-polyprenyl-3-methyl-5-hydroxy-6-metoxy-1,4-benzoquinol methylase
MYRCTDCHSAFVSPMPSPEQLRDFYSGYHRSNAEGGVYDVIDQRMKRSFPAKVEMVKQAAAAAGVAKPRVLDVGCGKGFFVRACADAGLDAEGIDISESGIRYATEQLGVTATCADLHEVKHQLGRFDVVTSWATLEHLPDALGNIRDMGEVLRPGGRLLAMTCAGDDVIERLLPGVTQWYCPPEHLVIFSADAMRRALEAGGFEVEHLDTNWEYTRARKVVRMARNVTTAALLRAVATAGRLNQGPFQFSRFPIGNDMVAIARRV